jgi:hypothetical protein
MQVHCLRLLPPCPMIRMANGYQLPFFIEFLKVSGVFDELVEQCPLRYDSPNAVGDTFIQESNGYYKNAALGLEFFVLGTELSE